MRPNQSKVSPDVLASKGIRFANFIIDYIVQIVIGIVLGVAIALFAELTGSHAVYDFLIESESRLSDYIFGIITLLVYYIVIEGLTGRSIGKFVTKTKVVTHDGEKPTFTDIIIRSLSRVIPFEQFSFLGDD